jgi:hypothetical protein
MPESLSKPNSVSSVLPAVYFANVRRETFIVSPYLVGTYVRTKDGRFGIPCGYCICQVR